MASFMELILFYIKQRFSFFPWMILPIILILIGHKAEAPVRYVLLYPMLWGVLFFRVFEDIGLYNRNKVNYKLEYTKVGLKTLLVLGYFSALMYVSSVMFLFLPKIFILNLAVILLASALYFLASSYKYIGLLSIIKYPVLLFSIASFTGEENYIWVILASVFFAVRDFFQVHSGCKNLRVEIIVLVGLVFNKYLLMLIQ